MRVFTSLCAFFIFTLLAVGQQPPVENPKTPPPIEKKEGEVKKEGKEDEKVLTSEEMKKKEEEKKDKEKKEKEKKELSDKAKAESEKLGFSKEVWTLVSGLNAAPNAIAPARWTGIPVTGIGGTVATEVLADGTVIQPNPVLDFAPFEVHTGGLGMHTLGNGVFATPSSRLGMGIVTPGGAAQKPPAVVFYPWNTQLSTYGTPSLVVPQWNGQGWAFMVPPGSSMGLFAVMPK